MDLRWRVVRYSQLWQAVVSTRSGNASITHDAEPHRVLQLMGNDDSKHEFVFVVQLTIHSSFLSRFTGRNNYL